ncbi:MAG TPA: prepilin-type N-terminal cleavage/methylation domain-containing protein [Rickettsiales bacterium]|nr:prepilin-type N-terminal cleavage/methylation domain-containing protein [Rickettsiales bacterium]
MSKSGFTLIEISIVLVIIGLIVGGILTGQELIKASQRRAILSEVEKLKTAVMTFQSKYNAIPGDMANATTFWGDCACGGGWSGSLSSTATNNGNGNGLIDGSFNGGVDGYCDGKNYMSVLCDDEPYYFWKHLANAGLINNSYTGTLLSLDGSTRIQTIGQNIAPSTVNPKWGYSVQYMCLNTGGPMYFSNNNFCGNAISLGTAEPSPSHDYENLSAYSAFSPLDAMLIDSKIDDGKPGSGSVNSPPKGSYFSTAGTSNCTTSATASASAYNTSVNTPECSLFFLGGF